MKKVFLESHNLKNKFTGFGQFNYHLIKAIANNPIKGFKITLHAKNVKELKTEFGSTFKYKKYRSITRHKPFRIKTKYNLWHCLNQNIKIEPFYDIPYLLTVHDIHFVTEGTPMLRQTLKTKFSEKLRRANAIVYISEFAKKDTHEHFDVPDIPEYVIYNGNTITDINIPKDYKPEITTDRPYLFSIGDFSERKNFLSLVEMMQFLPDYDLILAGDNNSLYADKLTAFVKNNGLKNRVFQTGKIKDLEKQFYLQHCTAFVFPSHREGFGIPPIEAMRFGKPVFISNNTSLPEIGGEHSFYWDHYEPQYMADTLKLGMARFRNAQDFYEKWYVDRAKSFSWEKTAKEYLEVYRKLLEI
ncbi:glycosyltransferase family 4 protein [Ulvibacter antarcticus]|uniref:Glycosyltransferase involved in cell wall biosynthesis n=1 Tax=Ulvibacter antarcticus TaxID=442714 RepID=A0A3L9YVR3_9FLAO|nr:glycosyltransferase family 1 protein [Ulvibacter antarcticus]RMA58562.1 glycosyltransferase involved in cell wall biosynthesis [Ulvibacter antarcticus]